MLYILVKYILYISYLIIYNYNHIFDMIIYVIITYIILLNLSIFILKIFINSIIIIYITLINYFFKKTLIKKDIEQIVVYT